MRSISSSTLGFLKKLKANNNREWFNEHKPTFKAHEADMKAFWAEVQQDLEKTDLIDSHKIYRIYRDIRFSKDKTPFKCRFSGGFQRATEALRGGYWMNIEPGNSMVGGGFYNPNPADLKRIRKDFEMDDSYIRKIIKAKKFQDYFQSLEGEEVKTAPRGFDVEHPAIDLIRKKQFYVFRSFTDKEVTSPDFITEVNKTFKAVRPFFDYMSDVLTTDLNGESILEGHN